MKNLYVILLIVTLGIPFNTNAQDSNSATFLIGSWVFDYDTSVANLSATKKEQLDSYSSDIKIVVSSAYKNRKLYLNVDNTYTQVLENGNTTNGGWSYDTNERVLKMTNSQGASLNIFVTQLTKDNLLFAPYGNGSKTLLFSQRYYTKLKI